MENRAKEQEALISQSSGKTALLHVVAAVELYMKAVQEASNTAERDRLRKKCVELMAFGERLKTTAESSVPVGVASPSLEANEASLDSRSTSRSSLPPGSPTPMSATSKTLPRSSSLRANTSALGRNAPASTRMLTNREQIILLKSSKLHGSVFPPWEAAPGEDVFSLASTDGNLYVDATRFSMSSQQGEIFAGWKRPGELLTEALSVQDPLSSGFDKIDIADKLMVTRSEPDLVQDITADCSVVASLCAIAQFANDHRDQASILATIIRPFDAINGQPLLSENGKYIFRLQFNGAFRKVVIDDRLPSSKSRSLFVVDRQNPYLLWPALLEKAYLKLYGGYEFPGGNSGTDLWILTGWIPEQVFLQSAETDLDLVWARTKGAFERGDVMITLGTGRLTLKEEALFGLAGQHDYAVLKLEVDSNGARRMLVKNPWCDSLVWHGRGLSPVPNTTGPLTTSTFWIGFEDVIQYFNSLFLNWDPSLFKYRQDHHLSWTLPSKAVLRSFVSNPQYAMVPDADGTVWILLSRHMQDAELEIICRKRQLVSTVGKSDGAEQATLHVAQPGAKLPDVGFITLCVFMADGKRVHLPDRPRWIKRAPLVDSAQTLVCFEARRAVPYTIVVAQSSLPLPSYSFTLSFFSSAALTIGPAVEMLAHQYDVSGEWSRATAGGSAASPDFVQNPQYALTILKPTPLSLLLSAEAEDVPVRVDLVWARGRRVASLAVRDLVVSSGEYQRGCALATVMPRASPYSTVADSPPTASHMSESVSSGNGSGTAGYGPGIVEAGTYTVVVSTFERTQLSRYTLRIGSAVPVEVHAIPAEDSGKLRTSLEPLMLTFDGSSRSGHVGCLGDGEECNFRAQAALNARLNTRVSLVVQAVERRAQCVHTATATAAAAASTIALRVSIERITSGGGRRVCDVVATTGDGEFLDMTVAGLRTDEITLGRTLPFQGQDMTTPSFRVVVEMRNVRRLPSVGIRVDVLSSDRVEAQPWMEY